MFTVYSLFMSSEYDAIPSPCYVLDESRLIANLELISRTAAEAGVSIIPALKGFAFWAVFPLVARYVGGAAASSLNEARLIAEEMGVRAHSYAPVFDGREFDQILALSSHVSFNSSAQTRRFLPLIDACNAASSRRRVSWGLRVNPGYSPVETPLYNPAAPESRLGISRRELDEILLDLRPVRPEGLHAHVLCESSAEGTAGLIRSLEDGFGDLLPQLSWVNLGGGHLLTRAGYDLALFIRELKAFRSRHPNLTVYLEPGSAFAWESGFLRASVEDIVERGGIRTAIADISFTAHMPDCLEMPYQPRVRGAAIASGNATSDRKERYRIGGNSCLAGDVMGDWLFDKPLAIGDPLIFEDMIHYTMVKTTMFNGVHHPAIGLIDTRDTFRLVREFGYPDYRNRLS